MIPCDTLELIQSTAQQAQTAKILENLNTDGRVAHVQIGNDIRDFTLPPATRNHNVFSLEDLVNCAKNYQSPKADVSSVVWHSGHGVILIIDDKDRRDKVAFPLSISERYATLLSLAKSKSFFPQSQFIRLLRIDLGLDNLTIVSKFRKIQWANSGEGEGNVQHGSDRVGKSITAKVQNIEDIPDELNVSVPVYQQTGERTEYVVRCALEIDTVNQQFQLVPMPDELERIIDLAQGSIHERLITSLQDFPVYYGEP